jgi:hypothetical protein
MTLNGVSCRLALLTNTISYEPKANNPTPFGPATAFWRNDELCIGNLMDGVDRPPISILFRSAVGDKENDYLSIELPYGSAFPAGNWLEKFANGWAAAFVTDVRSAGPHVVDLPERIADGESVVVALVTGGELGLRLRAQDQSLEITPVGRVGVEGDYTVIASNTAARRGMRSGSLRRDGGKTAALTADLPEGIDFRDGLEHLWLHAAATSRPGPPADQPGVDLIRLSAEELAVLGVPTAKY